MSHELSIAVLPFKNISSSNENDYFCDGLTEEIINALAKINGLKVTSRTSSFFFKDKDIPITQIGRELNVSTIIEGSVRLSQDKIRITAQLIEVQNDSHFWSRTWDRSLKNIFDVQDEISLSIADKIRENFGHFELQERLVDEQTQSIEAYKNYLKGQYHYLKWNHKEVELSITYFEKAISLDSKHAESYFGLGQSYSFMAGGGYLLAKPTLLKAQKCIDKAFDLNDKIPEVYFGLAGINFWRDWDIDKTLINIDKTLKINPNYSPAYLLSAFTYAIINQKQLALKSINIGLNLDPFSPNMLFTKAWICYINKDYQHVLKYVKLAIEKDSKLMPAYELQGCCLLMMKKYDEVLTLFSEEENLYIDHITKTGMRTLAYALQNNKPQVDKNLEILEDQSKSEFSERAIKYLFLVYSVSNKYDLAFELLAKCIKNKLPSLVFTLSDPLIESLKNDVRFHTVKQNFFKSKLMLRELLNEEKPQLLDEHTIKIYTKKLFDFINKEQPYLNPNISLRGFALDLELHPNQLSWLINHELNKNFNEFINQYRVETFKRISKDPKNSHITLIGLAYDSGFNSKTVFNTSFKKETGMTPMQYLKLQN